MNYLIANSVSFDDFIKAARTLLATGHSPSVSYVEHFEHPPGPGGWGCLRTAGALPSEPVFTLPNVEYRYSASIDAWLEGGVVSPLSDRIKSLHAYFIDAPWGEL